MMLALLNIVVSQIGCISLLQTKVKVLSSFPSHEIETFLPKHATDLVLGCPPLQDTGVLIISNIGGADGYGN